MGVMVGNWYHQEKMITTTKDAIAVKVPRNRSEYEFLKPFESTLLPK